MHTWKVVYDPKTDVAGHTLPPGRGHSLLSPLVGQAFKTLRVSATLWDGYGWWPINSERSVQRFEDEHAKDAERGPYNDRMFEKAKRTKKIVRGEHAGYSDFFVPVLLDNQVVAVLAVGPIARARPTSEAILESWRWITGRHGHPTDPEFAAYLSATLATLVLDARRLVAMERLLACFAQLMGGRGSADALMSRIGALRAELEPTRMVEHIWDVVREMVDERSPRTWHGAFHAFQLKALGLSRVADHVLVGLIVSRSPGIDPVEEAIRCDAFQRSSVDLARSVGGMIAGQVGDHGVVFLSAASGNPQRKKQNLHELSDRIRVLGRQRFGLALHFGASVAPESASLGRSYHAALAAAESALAQGTRIVFADEVKKPTVDSLRHQRHELGRILEENPKVLAARFDRYTEAVHRSVRLSTGGGASPPGRRLRSDDRRPSQERRARPKELRGAERGSRARRNQCPHAERPVGGIPSGRARRDPSGASAGRSAARSKLATSRGLRTPTLHRGSEHQAGCSLGRFFGELLFSIVQEERAHQFRGLCLRSSRRARQAVARQHRARHTTRGGALGISLATVFRPRVPAGPGHDTSRIPSNISRPEGRAESRKVQS